MSGHNYNAGRTNANFQDESRRGKQVVLPIPEKLFADFIIKINHESIPFRRFFHMLMEGYLEEDKRVVSFVEERLGQTRPKYQTKILKKQKELEEKTEKQFGLNPDEIELNDNTLRSAIGQDREMNVYDFKKALRKDSRWQYTENAREEVANSVLGVLRDFGFQG